MLCLLLLVLLGFQLHQQCKVLPHKVGSSGVTNISGRDVVRSPRVEHGHAGGGGGKTIHDNLPAPPRRPASVSATSRTLTKGISLSDVQAALSLDEQSVFLEAVETLKQRRISSYYGDRHTTRAAKGVDSERDDKTMCEFVEGVKSASVADAAGAGVSVPAKGSVVKGKKEKGGRKGKVTEERKAQSEPPAATAGASSGQETDNSVRSPTNAASGSANCGPDRGAPNGGGSDVVAVLSPPASPPSAPLPLGAGKVSVAVPLEPPPPPEQRSSPQAIIDKASPAAVRSLSRAQSADQTVETLNHFPLPCAARSTESVASHTMFPVPPVLAYPSIPLLPPASPPATPLSPMEGAERGLERTRVDLSIDPSEALIIAPSLSDSGNNHLGRRPPVLADQHSQRLLPSPPAVPASTAALSQREGLCGASTSLGAPPGLTSPLTPLRMPDRMRSISTRLESMVASIVDTDSYDNLSSLGEDPMGAFGSATIPGQADISPMHDPVYTATDAGRAPQAVKSPPSTSPPGFAGALGIYAAPLYEDSLFSSPSLFADTHLSPPSSGLRSPTSAHAQSPGHMSSMFTLPTAVSNVPPGGPPLGDEDDLGWAAMLTMPLEDMMQVEARGMGLAPRTQWPQHCSPSSDAVSPTSSPLPWGSSLDIFFGSPPFTGPDVRNTSLGHVYGHTHTQMQQAPVGGSKPLPVCEEARGVFHAHDTIYAPGRGGRGSGRGGWPSREMCKSVSQSTEQLEQQNYSQFQSQRHQCGVSVLREASVPLTHDDHLSIDDCQAH